MKAIYQDWFQLKQAPFAITPDPAFVYLSGAHQEALAHLLYGVGQGGGGGFVQLTGEVGTGKTTLCRCLLEQVEEGTHIALILNPLLNPEELIEAILHELQLDETLPLTHKQRLDRLNEYLLATYTAGERVVVIIDEAQNLPPETLEQLRLLTNLETNTDKLLQIILLGQPELRDLLGRNDLRQLAQRITARFHLTPLNQVETAAYVKHRLAVAGKPGAHNPFTTSALKALYRTSSGVPRLINTIADRAMLAAYASEQTSIDSKLIYAAAEEVTGKSPATVFGLTAGSGILTALLIIVLLVAWYYRDQLLPGSIELVQNNGVTGTANPGMETNPPEDITTTVELAIPAVAELLTADRYRANKEAWSGMARVWGVDGQGGMLAESCKNHTNNGFACLQLQGNWLRVRDLNLPVIIELGNGDNPDQLLLIKLTAAEAEIYPLGRIGLQALEQDWRGRYLVIWPQDPDWPMTIHADQAGGEVVQRLKVLARNLMPAWQGDTSPRADPQFGSWLRTFQRSWGLEDDGIIGPETLLYLIAPSLQAQLSQNELLETGE
ncbi:MAG: AAA family ATPase [Proteobacteria bacterium]|nr:AAA family ATPase [Pseudomonadota bacterium]